MVLFTMFLLILIASPAWAIKAFPTAEGYGADTTIGGRGGIVMKVTNLNDSGSGSLRACVEGTVARTCVFTVAGTIPLASPLVIGTNNSYLTIAAQTAPFQGIQVKNYSIRIVDNARDIIIRHLKFRPGIEWTQIGCPPGPLCNPDTLAFNIGGGTNTNVKNVILDHIEIDWWGYIGLNFFGPVTDTTIQWSILCCGNGGGSGGRQDSPPASPSLGFNLGYAMIMTSYNGNANDPGQTITLHHNLIHDVIGRDPQIQGTIPRGTGVHATIDYRNNYHYDWANCDTGTFGQGIPTEVAPGCQDRGNCPDGPFDSHVNIVGNIWRFRTGYDIGLDGCNMHTLGGSRESSDTRLYVYDNQTPHCPGSPNCAVDEWNHRFLDGVTFSNDPGPTQARFRAFSPFSTPTVTTHPRGELEAALLNKVGPRVPWTDSFTQQTLNELANKSGQRGQNGTWPDLTTGGVGGPPTDTDGDGMPDSWETSHGLNPNLASDRNDIGAGGYTNLEIYLNDLAGDNSTPPTSAPPAITITQPVSTPTYSTSTSPLTTLAGTASDDTMLAGVSVSCSPQCGSPTVSGSTSWSVASIPLTSGSNVITATATDGEGQTASDTLTVTYTPSGPGPSGTVYYVALAADGGNDANNCTPISSPCATIQRGISRLAPGDTLYIRGGNYAQRVDGNAYDIPDGTSWATATTIAGYPGEFVRLAPGGGGGPILLNAAFNPNMPSVKYVIFDNFLLDATSCDQGVYIHGDASYIRIQNSEIRFANAHGVHIGSGSHHLEFVNLYVHDNGQGFYHHGFYVGSPYTLLDRVRSTNNTGMGVQLFDTTCQLPHAADCTTGTIIKNSLFQDNASGGIIIGHGEDIQVYNNVVYNNETGIDVTYNNINTQVYNNTVHGGRSYGILLSNQTQGATLRNNILSGNAAGSFNANGAVSFQTDHNLCSNADTGCDIVDTPGLVAPGTDWHLQATSAARNRGTALPLNISPDYYLEPRPQLVMDIGAAEYRETSPSSSAPIYVRVPGTPGATDNNSCAAAEFTTSAKITLISAFTCMTTPGKIIYIETGTYVGEINTINMPITGGLGPSYSNATRIEGYGAGPVIIQSPVGGISPLWLKAVQGYLVFKNLVLDAANNTPHGVIISPGVHHIRFENVDIKNVRDYEGFYVSDTNNIELETVFIHSTGSHALNLEGNIDTFLCKGCHLYQAGDAGLSISAGGTKTNITIRETEIRNNATVGADIGPSTGTLLQNLLIHSNGSQGMLIRSGAGGVRSYNSTIYGNTGMGLQCDSGATTAELKNNIVYGNTAGNILNNCSAVVAKNLCAVSSANCELGGDPLFVAAPSDLRLRDNSPGINAGVTIPSITTDYTGTSPRQQDAQDIGAYERTQAVSSTSDITDQPCNVAQAEWFF